MYFNRLDIIEAWYQALGDCHSGQWSPEYSRLCQMDAYFRPSPLLSLESLTDNARQIYATACARLLGESEDHFHLLDELHDLAVSRRFGPPTAEGYILGLHLLAAGKDLLTAATEINASGMTSEPEEDES